MDRADRAPGVGEPVHSRLTKYDGSPHWQAEFVYLGMDGYGQWLGAPAGTWVHRPGAEFTSDRGSVRLVPHQGCFLASVNAVGNPIRIYIDVTTEPSLLPGPEGWTLRAADLDLDVVRRADGVVFLDDEDEFAEHRQTLRYPAALVAQAEQTAGDLLAMVRGGAEPYGEVGARWLDRLDDCSPTDRITGLRTGP